jgi:hypothetical protein
MACDPNELLQQACDSGFAALSDRDLKVAALQLLCSGNPPVLTSPNGTAYRLVVANNGTLSTEPVT